MKKHLLLISVIATSLSGLAQIPTSGLVAHYPFNGNANDISGSSNNGTMTNGAAFTIDRFGNSNSSASLDGVDDYVGLPSGSSTLLNITGDFSVSFWTKTSDNSGLLTSLGNNVLSPYEGYVSGIDGGNVGSGKMGASTRGNWTGSINSINDNTWHNVIYTLQSGTLTIYIDNVLDRQVTGALSPLSWSGSRTIGCRHDLVMTAATNYAGSFDDLLIYNRALTVTEVGQVYSNTCSAPDISTGLVAQYDFSGNANDVSGNGNNGTVNGATLVADRFGNSNNAYSFDGINNYIEVANSSSLQFASNLQTVSFWMKLPSLPNPVNEQAIFEKMEQHLGADATGNSAQGFKIIFNPTADIYYAIKSGNGSNWGSVHVPNNLLSANQYYNVVFTNDNDSLRSYLNGVKINATKIPTGTVIGANISPLLIGKELWTSNGTSMDYFNGILDDIKIYSRTLTDCDIDSLFNTPNSTPTGIKMTSQKSLFNIYPNPATEKVTIEFNSNESKQMNVELFDLLGNLLLTTPIASSLGENKVELNLSEITNGIYLVRVNNSVQKIQVNK